ncbi:MAG TPA: hypothetical protein VEO36_14805 [Casimicrobiaceae bacterium]|nr:hypothetical protein [Casimicrobiaceae bacterium]
MPVSPKVAVVAALLASLCIDYAQADKKTVCTITVNSPDEKEIFRRSLPADEFQFVELVERGRPDWLASACSAGVRCDVLVISGHFDGGDEFYSDRPDVREYLPVDEMERVSCSDSCPGLFSQLKEVYLFGCNTLNADAQNTVSAEVGRSLLRNGHSPADVERLSRLLNERHGDSNRDRMRQIFVNVPLIYGFSSKAPLGATAGPLLDHYFQSGPAIDSIAYVGSGRASPKLLGLFARSSMTSASGLRDADPQADYRRDVCHFADDRLSTTQKLGFVHDLLRREMAEVRMFLGHIEKYSTSLAATDRLMPAVSEALDAIARDRTARQRYLEFARDADEPAIRARMMKLARNLGWLSSAELRVELVQMMRDRLLQDVVGPGDVDLFCSLNKTGELDDQLDRLAPLPITAKSVGHAAVLACLGSEKSRARVLRALTSSNDEDVQIAQVYLHHHPIADADELRAMAAEIARMKSADAQVRALDTLARYQLSDRESLDALTRLFPLTKSIGVQRAIAGVLIRADYHSIANPELVRALRQHRLKSPSGEDLIDVLIRRLQS